MCPLGLLTVGERGEIIEIKNHFNNISILELNYVLRLDELGLRAGRTIEMLNNNNNSSILIKIDNSRLALSRKIAMKIFVRKQ